MNKQDLQEYADTEIWGCISESVGNLHNGAYALAVECTTLDDLERELRNWLVRQQSENAHSREWMKHDHFSETADSVWADVPAFLFADRTINIGDIMDLVIGWLPEEHPLRYL